jgi:hypothetical protein
MKSNVKRAKKIKHNGVYGAYQHQKKKKKPGDSTNTEIYICRDTDVDTGKRYWLQFHKQNSR